MNEMIRRIGAAWNEEWDNWVLSGGVSRAYVWHPYAMAPSFGPATAKECEDWISERCARAAVLSMKKGTAEMMQAGAKAIPDSDESSEVGYAIAVNDAADVWEAIIDEILK